MEQAANPAPPAAASEDAPALASAFLYLVAIARQHGLTTVVKNGNAVTLLKRADALRDDRQPFSRRWFVPELLRQGQFVRDATVSALVLTVLARPREGRRVDSTEARPYTANPR